MCKLRKFAIRSPMRDAMLPRLLWAIGLPGLDARAASESTVCVENALTELRAGRIERAEALCNWILESTPQDPAAHQLATTIALRRGRVDEAARWANSSLSLRPDHSPTLIIVARAAGDFAQARMWLNRAGRLAPDRPEPAFLTCVMLIEAGDREARTVLEDLLVRFPNFVDGWREIVEALRKLGHTGNSRARLCARGRIFRGSDGLRETWRGAPDDQPPSGGYRRFSTGACCGARPCRSQSGDWSACVRRAHCNWPASSLNEP